IKISILIPLVIMFAFAGAYVFRSDPVDLLMLVAFGVFGIVARIGKFDVMPMVMGFILGPPMEYAFGQTVAMGNQDTIGFLFNERLGALGMLLATPVVGFLLWRRMQSVALE
ncbi:MAG: hypothetical protein D6754_03935, partial [Alphaproteobacteria bacterium]